MKSKLLNCVMLFTCFLVASWPVAGLNKIIDVSNKKADELAADLAGLNPVSSLGNLIDIPDDAVSNEQDNDAASGADKPKDEKSSKNGVDSKNKTTTEAGTLIHMTFDDMCKQALERNVRILPVYMVGWELKECSDINNVPLKRFKMDKYQNKKPKFDIPGMRIPMKGKEMTLMLIDPDAPSREKHRCRSWLHWLVVNIPKGNVTKGDQIVEYNPPSPAYRSGPHRYYFLLYEQNRHINQIDDSENNFAVRCGFSVRHFAEDNALIGPVAMNMFKTQRKRISEDKGGT